MEENSMFLLETQGANRKEKRMKSWLLEDTGKENLHLIDVPKPEPGAGQILIRALAVSLNFRDKAIIDGAYTAPVHFPFVLGSDLAGEVVAVGADVTTFQSGDRVVSVFKPLWVDGIPSREATMANLGSPLPGVLAEYVLLSAAGALKYPDYLTPAQASTLPIAAVTPWVALFEDGHLQPDQTVLIQGSGGVSLFGLQLAHAAGARVIATSRSSHKTELLKQLGASDVIDTSLSPVWDDEVRKLTGGIGVDHVLEVIGGDSVQRSINACAWGGHVAIIGFMESSAATVSLGSMMFPGVILQGVAVGSRQHMANLLTFLETHQIQPIIDTVYDFHDLSAALGHLDRGPMGKVVIQFPTPVL